MSFNSDSTDAKLPTSAVLLLGRYKRCPIVAVHFETGLVTLRESSKVYNTVSYKDVVFDVTGLSEDDRKRFLNKFKEYEGVH